MMRAALKVSEAYRPRSEGGDAVGLVGSVGIVKASRPRSAITLSLASPGLAPTGRVSLGRGNRRRSIRRSEVSPNHHSGQMACRGFEACDNLLSEQALHSPSSSALVAVLFAAGASSCPDDLGPGSRR